MRQFLWYVIFIIGSLTFVSCAVEQQNTEIHFTVNFLPIDNDYTESFCWDEIRAAGKPEIEYKCIDSANNNITLPLDINSDTTVFIFKRNNICDTLALLYKREIIREQKEFSLKAKKVKVCKATFDSLSVECKRSNICDEVESITIFY
ncbi:MAG TPA: hypothetical protein VIK89_11005 [Cytophagaceae bacterium]